MDKNNNQSGKDLGHLFAKKDQPLNDPPIDPAQEKPVNVDIRNIASSVLPGSQPNTVVLQVVGNGDDNKLYFWYGNERKWMDR